MRFLALGWVLCGAGLYGAILLLDVYWNLLNWRPRWDWPTYVLLGWMIVVLAGQWRLAKIPRGRWNQVISLMVGLALVAVAGLALGPEPLSEGLLGRDDPSPWWYRIGRAIVLALPLATWMVTRHRKPRLS